LGQLVQRVVRSWAVAVVFANVRVGGEIDPDEVFDLNSRVVELIAGWKPLGDAPFIYTGSSPTFGQNRVIREHRFSIEDFLYTEYRT
jgi:hypothetical protein